MGAMCEIPGANRKCTDSKHDHQIERPASKLFPFHMVQSSFLLSLCTSMVHNHSSIYQAIFIHIFTKLIHAPANFHPEKEDDRE